MSDTLDLIHAFDNLVQRCTKCPDITGEAARSLRCQGTNPEVMFIAASPSRVPCPAGGGCRQDSYCNTARNASGLDDAYCTYLVKCAPPNGEITMEHLDHCIYFLKQEVEALRPRLIVTVGRDVVLKDGERLRRFNFVDLIKRMVTKDIPITWTYDPDTVHARKEAEPEIIGFYNQKHEDIRNLVERL